MGGFPFPMGQKKPLVSKDKKVKGAPLDLLSSLNIKKKDNTAQQSNQKASESTKSPEFAGKDKRKQVQASANRRS